MMILNVYIFQFCLAAEIFPDKVLSVNGIVTHVEFHDAGDGLVLGQVDGVKSHVLADEIHKLVR